MNYDAFYKISYGLYVVGSTDGKGKLTGHISNTVFQTSAEPQTIAVCSNKSNLTTDFIKESGVFAVSALCQDIDLKFIGNFGFKSGRDFDKYGVVNKKIGSTGAPILLDKSIAYFECRVLSSMDIGTHMLFVGEVVDAELMDCESEPLTYQYYRTVIKGLSPKSAPTYIDKNKK